MNEVFEASNSRHRVIRDVSYAQIKVSQRLFQVWIEIAQ